MYSVFLTLILLTSNVLAIPFWSGIPGTPSINSYIPGVVSLKAISFSRSPHAEKREFRHVTLSTPGETGNLTIIDTDDTSPASLFPSLFYIWKDQLVQLQNETTVFSVNLIPSSKSFSTSQPKLEREPLQLVVGAQDDGIQGGSWHWKGQKLFYELSGVGGSNGVYYDCGKEGVFLFLKRGVSLKGCKSFSLHSVTYSGNDE